MKYLILLLLFLFSCNKDRISNVEDIKDTWYVFTSYYTTGYSSTSDTTIVYLSDTEVCIESKEFSYCDNIKGVIWDSPASGNNLSTTLILSDNHVMYTFYKKDGKIRSVVFSSQIGEIIKLGDLYTTQKANYQSISMN